MTDPSPEPAAPVSMTPRTDAALCRYDDGILAKFEGKEIVHAHIARSLETECAKLRTALEEILTEGTPSRVHEIARAALETKL